MSKKRQMGNQQSDDEEALRKSKEKYRTLFNSIDEGFVIAELLFDDEGKPFDLLVLETNASFDRRMRTTNAVGKRAPTALNSYARWPSTRTGTDSATCEALRASSSRWPRNSSEAFTAFGETGGALGAPSTRSHSSEPSCFLAYLRRGFVRRTKALELRLESEL